MKSQSLSRPHSIIWGRYMMKIGYIVPVDTKAQDFEPDDIFQFCPLHLVSEILLKENLRKVRDFFPSHPAQASPHR